MSEEDKNKEEKKSEEKKLRLPGKLPWKYIIRGLIFLLGLAGLVALFPRGGAPQYSNLKLDFISTREIIAPFDFELLKSEEELKKEREQARLSVPPVFTKNQETGDSTLVKLDSLMADLIQLRFGNENTELADSLKVNLLGNINRKYNISLTEEIVRIPREQLNREMWDQLARKLNEELRLLYKQGVLDSEFEALNTSADAITIISKGVERRASFYSVFSHNLAKSALLESLKDAFPEGDKRINIGYEIVLNIIEPNLFYDKEVTEKRRQEAAAKVAPARGIVLKDERIIDSNERVTQEHLDKIHSLEVKRKELSEEEGGIALLLPLFGKVLFVGGILLVLALLLFNYEPKTAANKNFILILVVLLSHLAFLQLILKTAGLSTILFPSALAVMLITILFSYQVGFFFLGAMTLLAAAMQGNDFQLAVLTLMVGSVAIISVKSIRSRTQLLTSALYLAIAYLIFLSGYHFMLHSATSDLLLQLGLATLNSVMTPIFVLGFAIILGNIFDITTDLTLLELSDLNRPLLKKLAAAAPGTYHHSLMVGTLAEAAAEAVGANPLLARTAAYYHDIGKIKNRDYFIENQIVFNPHDTLKPEESAEILNSHVLDGLEMAEKHRLPQVIKDAIATHHGTTTMKYFYHKALKSDHKADEKSYKYTGPLPLSKETGIIMLADGVEAAVRSLGDASNPEVRQKVREMVEAKFHEGQLTNCELSIRDLTTIVESFTNSLKAQSHHRIAYPSFEQLKREASDAQANIDNA